MENTTTMKSKGFSLIELLIAMVIIGILAMVAYPSYQNTVRKSRRADAQGDLMALASIMERQFTAASTYMNMGSVDTDGNGVGDTGTPQFFSGTSPSSGGGQAAYNLTILNVAATTYTLQAAPIGAQAGDGIVTLNQAGLRTWDSNNDGAVAVPGEQTWDQ